MDLERVFKEEQPPVGGLFRLRKRLRQEGRKRFVRTKVLAWSTCLLVLLSIGIGFHQSEKPRAVELKEMPIFIAQDLPVEHVQVMNGAAIKLFESETVVYFQLVHTRTAKTR